jgi:arsenite oxidase small subunit
MNDDELAAANVFPVSRRDFLRIGCTTISGPLVIGMAPALASAAIAKDDVYPMIDVVALDTVKEGAAVPFVYPDASSPAVLLRLQQPATNGIGPNNTIVAYSGLCTHKGCPVAFRPERKLLICPCHWSSFDPAKAGQMVIGQGSQSLPQIALRINGKMIQATGVTGLIYGRETNIL